MRHAVHIDSFSGALGDLSKKLHGDDAAVLAVLEAHPRFTEWDVTPKMGKTLDRLKAAGRLRYEDEPYPWWRVTVLPTPNRVPCVPCAGNGAHHLSGRNWLVCQVCHGDGYNELPLADPARPTQEGAP